MAQMVRKEEEEEEEGSDEEAIFNCAKIWAEDGFDLNDRDKVMATAVVAALLLFRNYQRPGAVMGATLEEYSKAREVDGALVIMHRCGHSKKTDVRYLYTVTHSTCVGKVTRDLP